MPFKVFNSYLIHISRIISPIGGNWKAWGLNPSKLGIRRISTKMTTLYIKTGKIVKDTCTKTKLAPTPKKNVSLLSGPTFRVDKFAYCCLSSDKKYNVTTTI